MLTGGPPSGAPRSPNTPVSLEAPGRGTFPVALAVHVIGRAPEAAERAAGVAREAWIRAHRLNRLGSQAVPHWYGLYAGIAQFDGVQVPVYAGLVAAAGAPAQRWVSTPTFAGEWAHGSVEADASDAIMTAYKQVHDLGVVHRAAHPRNWHFGHGVAIAEWGRAHVRRRGFGFPRETDGLGIEWAVDEIEFERLRTAETKRVGKFFAESPW
jgi:hypothetical protein